MGHEQHGDPSAYFGWGGDPSEGGWEMHAGMGLEGGGMHSMMMAAGGGVEDVLNDDYGPGDMTGSIPQPMPEGPCVTLPALSLRQPFTSLVLYGVKQLEARNRPALKNLSGPLALHVSHREEPFGSPLVSTAVAILRRRYTDEAISSLFALPHTHAQGHGCIVGLVDVEATWPADLFNEIEQQQLTEQAIFPVGGTYITQLRNPRWLKCARAQQCSALEPHVALLLAVHLAMLIRLCWCCCCCCCWRRRRRRRRRRRWWWWPHARTHTPTRPFIHSLTHLAIRRSQLRGWQVSRPHNRLQPAVAGADPTRRTAGRH